MIIEFSVKNYFSVKDEVTLSMVAYNYDRVRSETLIEFEKRGLSKYKLLRSAVIVGANGAGKTTIISALETFRKMVVRSGKLDEGQTLPYNPFSLDSVSEKEPTELYIAFIHEGVKYEYEIGFDKKRIVKERLAAYPRGAEQVWIDRSIEKHSGEYIQSVKTSRESGIGKAVVGATSDNKLLLSVGALLNVESLKIVYGWFKNSLVFEDNSPSDFETKELLEAGSVHQKSFVVKLLRMADIGIIDAIVETPSKEEVSKFRQRLEGQFQDFEEAPNEILDNDLISRMMSTPLLYHYSTKKGNRTAINYGQESNGTASFFSFIGHIYHALKSGRTLVIDEFDAPLHPVLLTEIVRVFNSPELNPNGAQLIFTAHNACVLDNDLFRRDQIWFTEKDKAGDTSLYSLSDIRRRQGEVYARKYLAGQYGGIPAVPSIFGLTREDVFYE